MMPPNGLSYWKNNLKLSPTKSELDAALGKAENSLSLKSAELERSLADIDKLEKRIVELEGKLEAKAADLTRAQDHWSKLKAKIAL